MKPTMSTAIQYKSNEPNIGKIESFRLYHYDITVLAATLVQ